MNLQCENIHVSYDHQEILHAVNLEIGAPQLVSLLGPSGCGKSTLLKTIAGLIPPDQGQIFINDAPVNHVPPHKRGTVIVFQDLRLFPHMSAEENIAFPLKMQGVSKNQRLKKAADLLEMVQLNGFGKRKISQMSGGQLQRAALARALAANPHVLLLDEPFSSLDENLRQDMRNLVLDIHKELRLTTILVTHDPREALMISDKIAVMLEGRIVQYDDTRTLYNSPVSREVADYFGIANYLDGQVRNGIFESKAACFPVKIKDGSYQAMFRPTAIKLNSDQGEYEIIRIDYMGEHCTITLQHCDIRLMLSVLTNDSLRAGGKVAVEFDTSKAILLKS